MAITLFFLGILLLELVLRVGFGFGNPLLYLRDDEIGYLLAPNQRVKRLGNRIEINQYSMRSPAITPNRPEDTLRILLLGDSVANGGWWTDRDDTISALMAAQLKEKTGKNVEVLNASANSWSPRNQLAYLRRFGLFESQVLVLLINTDDLFGVKPNSLNVGRDQNYPEKKPFFALMECYDRYVKKPVVIPELEALQNEGGDRVGLILTAITNIHQIVEQNQGILLLALTPLLREIEPPGSRQYEKIARKRLEELTQNFNIPYLDFLPVFQSLSEVKTLYRDSIHLSPLGNKTVAESLIEWTINNRGKLFPDD